MITSRRSCGSLCVQHQVTLALLVVLSGQSLLLAAGPIDLVRDATLLEGNTCELRNGTTGIYRLASQCNSVLKTPLAVSKEIACSLKQIDPIVCCPVQDEPRINSTEAKRISILQCEKYSTLSNVADRIFNGTAAQYGEFPYIAALGYHWPNSSKANLSSLFRCSANLISPNYLLTAAHCLLNKPVFARLGVLELQTKIDEPLDVVFKKIILHPYFCPRMLHNDIGLLELEQNIPDWPFVEPVCLYPNTAAEGSLNSKHTLSVAGWGINGTFQKAAERLLKGNVNIIQNNECTPNLPPSRHHRHGLLPGQLCALGRNEKKETTVDTCGGDSGGPLELNVEGRQYLVGITSFGNVCGGPFPGIYTEVARYLDWIVPIVWSEALRDPNHISNEL